MSPHSKGNDNGLVCRVEVSFDRTTGEVVVEGNLSESFANGRIS